MFKEIGRVTELLKYPQNKILDLDKVAHINGEGLTLTIAREESERVIAFKGRPLKITCGTWNTISGETIGFLNLYDFSNLFQFTDWKDLEPTSIEDVLKNCEVIEDESSK